MVGYSFLFLIYYIYRDKYGIRVQIVYSFCLQFLLWFIIFIEISITGYIPMKENINKQDTRLHALTRKLQGSLRGANIQISMNWRVRACNRVWLDILFYSFVSNFFLWFINFIEKSVEVYYYYYLLSIIIIIYYGKEKYKSIYKIVCIVVCRLCSWIIFFLSP